MEPGSVLRAGALRETGSGVEPGSVLRAGALRETGSGVEPGSVLRAGALREIGSARASPGVLSAVAGFEVRLAGSGVGAVRSASRCHGYLIRPWYMFTSVAAMRRMRIRRSSSVRPDSSSWPAESFMKTTRWIISSNFFCSGGQMVRDAASMESTSIRIAVSFVCGFIPG